MMPETYLCDAAFVIQSDHNNKGWGDGSKPVNKGTIVRRGVAIKPGSRPFYSGHIGKP